VTHLAQADPALERAHELVQKHLPCAARVLLLNPPSCAGPPAHQDWRFWQPHFAQNRDLRRQGWRELEESAPGRWEAVVLYGSKHKEENWELLGAASSLLTGHGRLLFAVPNEYGSKSYQRRLHQADPGLEYESGRKSRLYKLSNPSRPQACDLVPMRRLPNGFWSVPGLFSWSGVDQGSAMLGEHLAGEKLQGPVADLGAGWGYLASRLEQRLTVHLFESDRRGLECARRNLKGRDAHFHWCDLVDTESWPEGAPSSFATVLTNPPFHSGRREQAELGQLFARLAHRLLPRGGTLWLVGNTHLGYPRLLGSLFSSLQVRHQRAGFDVIRAVK
jgi:16S rRNA (guanine1207-N2)-methyltransferase